MKDFKCKQCGRCCIHAIPQFEEYEYERVRDIALQMGINFVKMPHEDGPVYFTSKTFARVLDCMKGKGHIINGEPVFMCEFLRFDANKKTSCAIYDLRPEVCRLFGLNPKDLTKKCLNPENQ